MAKKLTRKQGDGQVTHWGMAQPSVTFWWNWVWSSGGELVTSDNRGLRITEPSAVAGIDFIRELRYVHEVIPPVGAKVNFNNGNIGFYHTNTFYAGPPNKSFNWSLTGFPRGPQSAAGYSRGGANVVVVSSQSKKQEAAWAFVKYLVSEKAQRLEVFETRVGNPVLRSIALTTDYLKRNEPPWDYTDVVMAEWKSAPTFVAWPDMENVIKDAVDSSWKNNVSAAVEFDKIMPSLMSMLNKK